jgi:hypothetical protein
MKQAELDKLVRQVTTARSWGELQCLIACGLYTPRLARDCVDDSRLGAALERSGLWVCWFRSYEEHHDTERVGPASGFRAQWIEETSAAHVFNSK